MIVSSVKLSDTSQYNGENAIALHANPSNNYKHKVAETLELLKQAVAQFSPVTQASSLGAEDVVITHLIKHNALNIPVFVLNFLFSFAKLTFLTIPIKYFKFS